MEKKLAAQTGNPFVLKASWRLYTYYNQGEYKLEENIVIVCFYFFTDQLEELQKQSTMTSALQKKVEELEKTTMKTVYVTSLHY